MVVDATNSSGSVITKVSVNAFAHLYIVSSYGLVARFSVIVNWYEPAPSPEKEVLYHVCVEPSK